MCKLLTRNNDGLQSLLAYLLVHRGAPQPRRHIAFLLYPDSSEAQARTNLRYVLHQLWRALPNADRCLHAEGATLQWSAEAPFALDVAEVEEAYGHADARVMNGGRKK